MDSVVVDIAPSGKEADSEEVNLQKFKKLLDEQASKTAFDLREANYNRVLLLFFAVSLTLLSEGTDVAMLPTYAREDRNLFFFSIACLVLTFVMRIAECVHMKVAGLVKSGRAVYLLTCAVFVVAPEAGAVLFKRILVTKKVEKDSHGYTTSSHALTHEVLFLFFLPFYNQAATH